MLLDLGETWFCERLGKGCNLSRAPVVLQHCRSFLFGYVVVVVPMLKAPCMRPSVFFRLR